jgi:hypothetical protein
MKNCSKGGPFVSTGQKTPKTNCPIQAAREAGPDRKNARRLLKSLGVNDPDEAPDDPGNGEILAALDVDLTSADACPTIVNIAPSAPSA